MIIKRFICAFLLLCTLQGNTQSKLTATINNYTESQKRLLAKNIGRFLYVVNQGQWDLDSCVLYACKIYGLNRLLPYDEMIGSSNIRHEMELLNSNRVNEAIAALQNLPADRKVRTLLELAVYYLHKSGTEKQHLDSAARFIEAARSVGNGNDAKKWNTECDALLGEYHFQKQSQPQSEQYFASIAGNLAKGTDKKRFAIALHQQALHLTPFDTIRIRHLQKAFSIFQQLKLNEHAIEVLSDIVTYYFMFDWSQAEAKLKEVLSLQKQSGYKHTMDTYHVLAYLKGAQADYMSSIAYTDSSVAAMTITGDSSIYSMACVRVGDLYVYLGELDPAYNWYIKGTERRQKEPQLFWYKNLFGLVLPGNDPGKMQEHVATILAISTEYPPQGKFDSLRLYQSLATCYNRLGNSAEAEKYISYLIKEIEKVPPEHHQVSSVYAFHEIAKYYMKRKELSQARFYLKKSWQFIKGRNNMSMLEEAYLLMYKLDSMEGKYHDAFINHKQFRFYKDTLMNINQRFKSQELNVRFETAKKDQDIKILTQQGVIQQSALQQARQTRNVILGGAILMFVIVSLLYNQFRSKQKTAKLIEQKNTKLVQLVDEKEWLLKEVHHRVKNNLQTILSLLELQSENLSHDALTAIQASQNRIYATSLLHQKLYQDENVSSINMNTYIPELIQHLKSAFGVNRDIKFKLNIEPIELDVSQAIPVGLITNELVTNSIKYAFKEKKEGDEIRISFTYSGEGITELLISDNGVGFSELAEKEATGLGLKLVRGLAEDIDGEAFIESKHGTSVRVQFKTRKPLASINDKIPTSIQVHEENTDR